MAGDIANTATAYNGDTSIVYIVLELKCVFVDQFGCDCSMLYTVGVFVVVVAVVGGKSSQFIHILNKIWFRFVSFRFECSQYDGVRFALN